MCSVLEEWLSPGVTALIRRGGGGEDLWLCTPRFSVRSVWGDLTAFPGVDYNRSLKIWNILLVTNNFCFLTSWRWCFQPKKKRRETSMPRSSTVAVMEFNARAGGTRGRRPGSPPSCRWFGSGSGAVPEPWGERGGGGGDARGDEAFLRPKGV